MYAKSIIQHVRERFATGAWMQQLSFAPVVMALAVATLPFTLDSRVDASALSSGSAADSDTSVAETPANSSMVKTAANASTRTAL